VAGKSGKQKCRARFPRVTVLIAFVGLLKRAYPQDPIELVDRGALEAAVESARMVFRLARAQPCRARIVLAGAKLFEELILRHPLVDGNKRLATLTLGTYLVKNGFPRRRVAACVTEDLAIKVALGRTSYRGVARWLRRCLRSEGRGK